MANKIKGNGYHVEINYKNTNVIFGDIPNIHSVKSAYKYIIDQAYDNTVVTNDIINWNSILQKMLLGATKIVNFLREGTFV